MRSKWVAWPRKNGGSLVGVGGTGIITDYRKVHGENVVEGLSTRARSSNTGTKSREIGTISSFGGRQYIKEPMATTRSQ